MDGNVSMSELQYGTSSSGVEEYLAELKSIAVEQAGQLVLDINEITQTCDQNWSGQAKENFKANLAADAQHVSDQFSRLYSVLEDEIRAASSAMIEKDRTMLQSDGYQAGAAFSSAVNTGANNAISGATTVAQNVSNATLGNAANAAYAVGDVLEGTNSPLAQGAANVVNGFGDLASGANQTVNNLAEGAGNVASDIVDWATGNNY